MRTLLNVLLVCSFTSFSWSAEAPTAADIAATSTVAEAVIHTPRGDIHVSLFPKTAPISVANFVNLTKAKFFDGLAFHRVEPGFVIQGGDPNSREGATAEQREKIGAGGPGYTIPAEIGEKNPEKHLAGTLAMADAGLNTAGSQFYLTMAPQSFLDGRYTVFGRVLSPKDLEVIRAVKAGDRFTVEIIAPDAAKKD